MNTVLAFFTIVAATGQPLTPTTHMPTINTADCRMMMKSVDAVNKYSINPEFAIIGSCDRVKK